MAQGQLAYYRLLQQSGHVSLLETAEELTSHWRQWTSRQEHDHDKDPPIGFILAMEGADAIVAPEQAEAWYEDGLRAVNLVHYGHNQYAVGTGESGPLTPAGIALLKEFERLGIILDATHLSDPSFFQALEVYGGPVIASHQLCRELVPHPRQFSDEQLRLLFEREAVIGVALDNWMIVPNWKTSVSLRGEVTLDRLADHVDHLCQLASSHRHVAIGSDLDGGFGTEQAPAEINTIADVQQLAQVLQRRGYPAAAIDDIFWGNWLRFFGKNLPATESAERLPRFP